jgi:hypothetical protein
MTGLGLTPVTESRDALMAWRFIRMKGEKKARESFDCGLKSNSRRVGGDRKNYIGSPARRPLYCGDARYTKP